jgi:hypothetical protein
MRTHPPGLVVPQLYEVVERGGIRVRLTGRGLHAGVPTRIRLTLTTLPESVPVTSSIL